MCKIQVIMIIQSRIFKKQKKNNLQNISTLFFLVLFSNPKLKDSFTCYIFMTIINLNEKGRWINYVLFTFIFSGFFFLQKLFFGLWLKY